MYLFIALSIPIAIICSAASAALSILSLALFGVEESSIVFSDIRWIELGLFAGGLYLLRRYKVNAIAIIFGSGIIGTLLYAFI